MRIFRGADYNTEHRAKAVPSILTIASNETALDVTFARWWIEREERKRDEISPHGQWQRKNEKILMWQQRGMHHTETKAKRKCAHTICYYKPWMNVWAPLMNNINNVNLVWMHCIRPVSMHPVPRSARSATMSMVTPQIRIWVCARSENGFHNSHLVLFSFPQILLRWNSSALSYDNWYYNYFIGMRLFVFKCSVA